MGGRDSSSKRKSSKRKRDKISSKKKSRRKEPKKCRRIYDSDTTDSDNGSLNSSPASESNHRRRINKNKKRRRDSSLSSYSDYESVSSDSDSDNAYKSRKARGSQVCLKDTKRRGRKTFTSPNVRKRKRLNKDHAVKPIKKSSKKKSRKYSSGSSSSDSESCSTCQSPSSSSTVDGKHQRSKEIERLRGRESHRGKKKHKRGTPIIQSCDRGRYPSVNDGDWSTFPMNNSRRLRSVIAVVDQPHDEGENRWEMDPQKEEIVYNQNDYPSPKSVDSNEGGGRIESGNHSHGVFSDKICLEKVTGEDVPVVRTSIIVDADQDNAGYGQLEADHTNDFEKDVCVPNAASGGDLLESILRQKALENLRKFKGRIETGPRSTTVKVNNESDMDRSSAGMAVIFQNKSINEGSSNLKEMDRRSGLASIGEFSHMKEVKKLPDSEEVDKDPGMAKQSLAHPPNGRALMECSKEDISVSRKDTGPGTGGANACNSTEPSPFVEQHSLELGNEAKDGSQFEQKTMSVMKDGEIVQVSYKVYIPKKAPALARRQLRR